MDWQARLSKVKATNRSLDAVDREAGLATPAGAGLLAHLATALEAIKAGGVLGDWDCVAEGVLILEDAVARLARAEAAIKVN